MLHVVTFKKKTSFQMRNVVLDMLSEMNAVICLAWLVHTEELF